MPRPHLHNSRPSDTSTLADPLPSLQADLQRMDPFTEEDDMIDELLSSDTEEPPRVRSRRRGDERAEGAMQLDSATDPRYNLEEQEKMPTTADIRHFFERTPEYDMQVLQVSHLSLMLDHTRPDYKRLHCRKARDADPVGWARRDTSRHTFQYSRNTSNTTLRGHIDRHHILEYITLAEANGWQIWLERVKSAMAHGYVLSEIRDALANGQSFPSLPPGQSPSLPPRQSEASTTNSASPSGRTSIPPEWLEGFHNHLVDFIVAADQVSHFPFFPDSSALRNMQPNSPLALLNPNNSVISFAFSVETLQNSDIPDRTKIRELIVHAWIKYFAVLKSDMALALGRISHTAGIWSNDNRRPFLAMTAHWITEESGTGKLKLNSALLAFHRIRENYTGESLARTILYLLDRAGTTAKKSTKHIQRPSDPIPSQWVATSFGLSVHPAYVATTFMDTVKTGNLKNWFKGPAGEAERVPELELLRDIASRWDSTYAMLNRLRALRLAVNYFLTLPNQKDLEEYILSRPERLVLEDFERILEVPYKVQQCMSSEALPRLGSACCWLRGLHMSASTWATQCYKRMDTTRAYVIAMFVDPAIRMSWIRRCWKDEYISSRGDGLENDARVPTEKSYTPTAKQQVEASTDSLDLLAAQFGIKPMGIKPRSQGAVTTDEEYHSANAKATPRFLPSLWTISRSRPHSIPCERVFSSSVDTDTKDRKRISPTLVEILQMLKYDFRKRRLTFTAGTQLDQRDLLEGRTR
ncbi:ribonuclease H-like domain-containing protein [Melanogaster broomeanus]|nr:ribonuclease H-like domain-containing protein [Melanogaster broomeanus]